MKAGFEFLIKRAVDHSMALHGSLNQEIIYIFKHEQRRESSTFCSKASDTIMTEKSEKAEGQVSSLDVKSLNLSTVTTYGSPRFPLLAHA